MPPALHVALRDIDMAFGDRVVFRGLSCGFPRGRISVILGGSGSGKSTILRLIGGLISPRSGSVVVDGEDVTTLPERRLRVLRQRLGMMFQGGALLDSLTVFDNLALPLRERTRQQPDEIAAAVHQRLAAVGLRDVDALLPGQLSGGMMRRVALARALILQPPILLCDEPFSGLDPISVLLIESLLRRLHREYGMTLVVVSHHVESTIRLAEHVLLLLPDATVEGPPDELAASTDPRVRAFFGAVDAPLDELAAPGGPSAS